MLKLKMRLWNRYVRVSLIALGSLGFSNSLTSQAQFSDEDLSNARLECLQEIQVECLLVLSLSFNGTETSPFATFDDGTGGRLRSLMRLADLDSGLPETLASLLAEDNFWAAAYLLIESKRNTRYPPRLES